MSELWNGLQMASFRNVEFWFETVEGQSGRRAIPHEYPKRDIGWTEDNGAKLKQFNIDAVLNGSDYRTALDALLTALNTPGPGKLVHPHFGEVLVQIGDVSHRLSSAKGGYASAKFTCFDAGKQQEPSTNIATQYQLETASDTASKQIESDFEADFDTGELPDYALDNLTDQAQGFIADMSEFWRQLPDVPALISEVLDEAERLKTDISRLLAAPGELALRLTDLLRRTEDLLTRPDDALSVYDQLYRRYKGKKAQIDLQRSQARLPVPGTLLDIEWQCSDELSHLMNAQTALASAGVVSQIAFGDAQLAIDTGNRVDERLQATAMTASTLGRRDSFQALRAVSVALKADINRRALLLPQVRRITLTKTEPIALIAYRETGDTRKREAIIDRNRPRHPGFMMPGTTLELVND
ncbi:DNA circularization N-terminal domain-containing protein [Shewanella algae]|uniref:DNA circularization protein n=1 Tax=Shewanella algae TaxID=38313 RepID=UPI001AAD7727|nr:DNA circularization N-terminal domain-containing protein [Shewanella algae]MBO2656202.1 DNA circularization N-terminal domain-containing protein [Shewanella algae]